MANVKLCVRFLPLSSKERRNHGDGTCIRSLDAETFVFKDEKLEEATFSFDRVFYEGSEQSEVHEFLALPVVRDVVSGFNGTIIAYGQVSASTTKDALQSLLRGIANRAVGETHMNMASSRSHCVYIFNVQGELSSDKRVKTAKLVLVDLAGSEKIEKTGAEGKVLEEAKIINKSLSALGNVINVLTCGTPSKANHIPYRDSKLMRILQDALGGNSRTALLCCCSPSPSNASESLSTMRFGAREKHIKTLPRLNCKEEIYAIQGAPTLDNDKRCERIREKVSASTTRDALHSLLRGIANRAAGVSHMNMASSRSHCVYIFNVQGELSSDMRVKTAKLVPVDLAGSEKIEKTGAEGKVLEEAKTINKSLSALGNVINALTCGIPSKANDIPYHDSKLARILQDALGGNSRTALLFCCSPSPSNDLESLSTLRFSARAKHIKTLPRINCKEEIYIIQGAPTLDNDKCCERILEKLREKLLEELFLLEGNFADLTSFKDLQSSLTISSLQLAVEELAGTVDEDKEIYSFQASHDEEEEDGDEEEDDGQENMQSGEEADSDDEVSIQEKEEEGGDDEESMRDEEDGDGNIKLAVFPRFSDLISELKDAGVIAALDAEYKANEAGNIEDEEEDSQDDGDRESMQDEEEDSQDDADTESMQDEEQDTEDDGDTESMQDEEQDTEDDGDTESMEDEEQDGDEEEDDAEEEVKAILEANRNMNDEEREIFDRWTNLILPRGESGVEVGYEDDGPFWEFVYQRVMPNSRLFDAKTWEEQVRDRTVDICGMDFNGWVMFLNDSDDCYAYTNLFDGRRARLPHLVEPLWEGVSAMWTGTPGSDDCETYVFASSLKEQCKIHVHSNEHGWRHAALLWGDENNGEEWNVAEDGEWDDAPSYDVHAFFIHGDLLHLQMGSWYVCSNKGGRNRYQYDLAFFFSEEELGSYCHRSFIADGESLYLLMIAADGAYRLLSIELESDRLRVLDLPDHNILPPDQVICSNNGFGGRFSPASLLGEGCAIIAAGGGLGLDRKAECIGIRQGEGDPAQVQVHLLQACVTPRHMCTCRSCFMRRNTQ